MKNEVKRDKGGQYILKKSINSPKRSNSYKYMSTKQQSSNLYQGNINRNEGRNKQLHINSRNIHIFTFNSEYNNQTDDQ